MLQRRPPTYRLLVPLLFACLPGLAQTPSTGALQTPATGTIQAPTGPDPLAVGKAALQHGDFAGAKDFFAKYHAENPQDPEAAFFLGGAQLQLAQYTDAARSFQAAVALKPDAWPAHLNLALAYAQAQDWKSFDAERALIKAARDAKKPGLSLTGHDVIDVLHVNGETYPVWYFYTLYGHWHTRYVVLHFTKDGKADFYIQCESDDVDQGFFKDKHPQQAAAGDRSFSLDSYSIGEKGNSQALHTFDTEGEPTYEQVRADALKVLEGRSKPQATTSTPAPAKK